MKALIFNILYDILDNMFLYREVDVLGKMILPPEMLAVFLLVAVAGTVILYVVANKKWGYTEKRERELEEQPELCKMKGDEKTARRKKPFQGSRK